MFDMFEIEHFTENKGEVEVVVLNERQNGILAFLEQEGRASVKKLAEHFFVSEMTVRRDLKEMERCGYLQRYNGGAVYSGRDELPVNIRKFTHLKEKKPLTQNAKKFLKDYDTVFIDSSSTCMYIIPVLAEYKGIKLVTNSVQNLLAAAEYHIPCIITGGSYYEHDMCCIGGITEEFMRNINVDVAFFSLLGITDDGIISDSDEAQLAVRKAAMQNSKKNVFFFDESKKGKRYIYTVCRAEEADGVFVL